MVIDFVMGRRHSIFEACLQEFVLRFTQVCHRNQPAKNIKRQQWSTIRLLVRTRGPSNSGIPFPSPCASMPFGEQLQSLRSWKKSRTRPGQKAKQHQASSRMESEGEESEGEYLRAVNDMSSHRLLPPQRCRTCQVSSAQSEDPPLVHHCFQPHGNRFSAMFKHTHSHPFESFVFSMVKPGRPQSSYARSCVCPRRIDGSVHCQGQT